MPFPVEQPKLNRYSVHVEDEAQLNLMFHQHEALKCLQGWFSDDDFPKTNAFVSMPTGSGKTGVMCCLPYFLGSIGMQRSIDPGNFPTGNPRYRFDRPILVIAPSDAIAKQLEGQILESPDELHENFLLKRRIVPEEIKKNILPVGVKIDGTTQLTNPEFLRGKDVVIANVQKFLSKKTSKDSPWWVEELPEDLFRLVIVDEAHHVPAPTWQRIINHFNAHALVVFFTATPYRSDGQEVIPEGAFKYHLSLKVARERRIIRYTTWNLVGAQSCEDEDVIFSSVLEKVREMRDIKNADDRYRLPNNVPHMAIAITKDIERAEKVVTLWTAVFGPDAAFAYHSKLSPDEEKKRMKKIRRNEVQLVVVVAKLLEGFDHQPISIAAILTKIGSPVKFAQFIGRAQRIVRGPEVDEPDGITADIVTHRCYRQDENHTRFQGEVLIQKL